ncbi:MAG: hypothetical protein SVJ22_01795 [Halobacteriota archaeon]|nr:hypothetical protein [Halobacteriota archaeon]
MTRLYEFDGDYSFLKGHLEKNVASLAGYLRFSTTPLVLDQGLFEELSYYNEAILKSVAALYEVNLYPHLKEDFVRRVERFEVPEESIVPVRLDYMRNSEGRYVCFDLNTQPGTPGSILWGSCGFKEKMGSIRIDKEIYSYFNLFSLLRDKYKGHLNHTPKVALYESEDSSLDQRRKDMLRTMCEVINGLGFFEYSFVREEEELRYYDIIEPFFNLNGDLEGVYSNYETALKVGKPLASNLKLTPYECKDFAFTNLLNGIMGPDETGKIEACIAKESNKNYVEKNLFGMSGSGFASKTSNNWPGRVVKQEALKPDEVNVSVNGEEMKMIYEIGVTSLAHFKKRRLTDCIPCVDITVKASTDHPISGPDTVVIPALVKR